MKIKFRILKSVNTTRFYVERMCPKILCDFVNITHLVKNMFIESNDENVYDMTI